MSISDSLYSVPKGIEGVLTLILAGGSNLLLNAYPMLAALAAVCGLVIGVHGVVRLIWRWWHGFPTFYDLHEKE